MYVQGVAILLIYLEEQAIYRAQYSVHSSLVVSSQLAIIERARGWSGVVAIPFAPHTRPTPASAGVGHRATSRAPSSTWRGSDKGCRYFGCVLMQYARTSRSGQ